MKFTSFVFLSLAITFTSSQISFQDSNVVKQKQDSILKAHEKKFWEKSRSRKSPVSFYFSLKGGYNSSSNPQSSDGNEEGWIFETSAGIVFWKMLMAGFKYEYWKSNDYGFKINRKDSISYDQVFTGKGASLMLGLRVPLFKERLNLKAGVGVGGHSIYLDGDRGGAIFGFLDFSLMAGFDIRIVKYLHLDAQYSISNMVNMEEDSRMFNFEIGPIFYFNF